MKRTKTIIGIIIGLIIGISTTVGATTVFNSKDITYSSSATTKTNVKDSLDELYIKAANVGKCPNGYYCHTTICPTGYTQGTDSEGYPICKGTKSISIVKVGDYISMTPTSTSYTISKELTGYTSDQTINPSELKLWKVVKKNNDGTITVVSEYVSSQKVYFRGKTGYMNLVGGLNTIAAQYTNSKYVQSTRHFGYSNQLEFCTTFSSTECPGDEGWSEDNSLIGTISKTTPGGTQTDYYAAGRHQFSNSYAFYVVPTSGGIAGGLKLYQYTETSNSSSVLPILTLKSTVQIKSGNGTSSIPYQLS